MWMSELRLDILRVMHSFVLMSDKHYHMIVDNPLLLAFVLMCAIFVGLALLKRLIHIN